ncbi:unnamed protein product [Sphenostylis stenocarpa]|uniref:HMA domain-containing protein n=1 Tax=Sphenostylis stenocarpa TaxID=92480 RepID=A0AA86SJ88_9FABA|nr:unnamed protein product [Sphenostylis stenocarpa]
MKQKIVIKLQMDCDKCRNKALKIAAEVPGVTSVALEGDDSDRVAVSGINVDTVCLANQLKKKFRSVVIVTVEDLKKAEDEKKKKDEEKKKKDEEEEKKRKEREEKLKKMLHAALCKKCKSSSCHAPTAKVIVRLLHRALNGAPVTNAMYPINLVTTLVLPK